MIITDEMVAAITNQIFLKGIERFCKKHQKEQSEVSILLYLKTKEEAGYQVYLNGNFKEETTIKEILGVKVVDLKGYSVIAPPYILKILTRLAEEMNSEKVDVSVYMNEGCDDVRYFLYNEGRFVKEVDIIDLLKIKT